MRSVHEPSPATETKECVCRSRKKDLGHCARRALELRLPPHPQLRRRKDCVRDHLVCGGGGEFVCGLRRRCAALSYRQLTLSSLEEPVVELFTPPCLVSMGAFRYPELF